MVGKASEEMGKLPKALGKERTEKKKTKSKAVIYNVDNSTYK